MSTICRLPSSVLASLRRIRRQHPVLERSAVAPGAGFASEHRHIVPGIVGRLAASEGSRMLGNDPAVLADYDPVRIGLDLYGPPDCARRHRIFVVVEAYQTSLGDRGGHGMEAVEAAGIRNQLWSLGLEDFPDGSVCKLRMPMRFGVSNAFVEQPGVQFIQRLEA